MLDGSHCIVMSWSSSTAPAPPGYVIMHHIATCNHVPCSAGEIAIPRTVSNRVPTVPKHVFEACSTFHCCCPFCIMDITLGLPHTHVSQHIVQITPYSITVSVTGSKRDDANIFWDSSPGSNPRMTLFSEQRCELKSVSEQAQACMHLTRWMQSQKP